MTIALWFFGVVAILAFLTGLYIIVSPPGDNIDARALGEILAVVPIGVGVVASIIWIILAAVHWI